MTAEEKAARERQIFMFKIGQATKPVSIREQVFKRRIERLARRQVKKGGLGLSMQPSADDREVIIKEREEQKIAELRVQMDKE